MFARTNRRAAVLLALVAAAIGCHDGTGPSFQLPTSLSVTAARQPLSDPSLTAAGDSVIASFTSGFTGCDDYTAAAVKVDGAVSVIVKATESPTRYCPAVLEYATYNVVVHDAPPGRYPVVISMRWITYDGKTASTQEIVRGVIALP